MLIYAASRPSVWSLALTIAGASRAIFVGLVMSHGTRFFDHQSGIAVIVDAAWVVVFAVYLFAACRAAPGAATGAPLGTA